jgi:hypothetical protein
MPGAGCSKYGDQRSDLGLQIRIAAAAVHDVALALVAVAIERRRGVFLHAPPPIRRQVRRQGVHRR